MSSGKNITLDASALDLCTYCPKLCRHACPVGNAIGSETLTPQSKMQLLNLLRKETVPWRPGYLLPAYGCTACGLCRKNCRHDNDVASALQRGRQLAVKHGIEPSSVRQLPDQFRARNERLHQKLRELLPPTKLAEEARVGYFPGCDQVDESPRDIQAALTVFERLGLDFVKVTDIPLLCAGYPLWAGGFADTACFIGEELLTYLRRFSTVVVGCPSCVYLLREVLPAEGIALEVEVLHTSEFLFVHAERLDIQRRKPAAFYHDPCFLGRYLDVYQAPRRLVQRCVDTLCEFFHARELAACCGGGGLVPQTYPQATAGQAKIRLQEVELYDVDLVVTACPTCERTFRAGAAESKVEIVDLVELLAWATGSDN